MSNQAPNANDNVFEFRPARVANSVPIESSHIITGGGGGDGMDPWQQTVETRLSDIKGEIRELRNWLVAGIAALFVFGCGVTAWTNIELQKRNSDLSGLDKRTELIQRDVNDINGSVKEIKAAVLRKK